MPDSVCLEDFIAGDKTTDTTAELTDAEVAEEVIDQRCKEEIAEHGPTGVEDITPPTTLSDAVAASAALRRCYSAIEASCLALVDSLDYIEQAVVKHAVASKKQAMLLQFFCPKE